MMNKKPDVPHIKNDTKPVVGKESYFLDAKPAPGIGLSSPERVKVKSPPSSA